MALTNSICRRRGTGASLLVNSNSHGGAGLAQRWTGATILALAIAGCGQSPEVEDDAMASIEGTVWYRERIALPPSATIQVFLENVAKMDVASDVIATTIIAPESGPPWKFELSYNPDRLDDRGRYVLRARIETEDGRLLFINTDSIPAFDGDEGKAREIRVSAVR